MDVGPRMILVRGEQRNAESEWMQATGRDRNVAINKDENSSSLITMSVKASLSMKALMHMFRELIYFVLYMHQQMPCTYEELQNCRTSHAAEEEVGEADSARSSKETRLQRGRERREAKRLRKLLKLKDEIERLVHSLRSGLSILADFRSVLLLLGNSPLRPKHVYEVQLDCELNGRVYDEAEDSRGEKSKSDLSRKLIRALISDAASSSTDGPMKLFLLVQASSNPQRVPEDFPPKRGFVMTGKRICRTLVRIVQEQAKNLEDEVSSISLSDRSPSQSQDMDLDTDDNHDAEDLIWYQCVHTVKGLYEGSSTEAL
ncbi:hypothetical protein R1sor_003923 [Riccia sorocarpa]|uniref:Uncharacterized protein n=1 Tax=Riccia sorocarpa TaxID=122646 RepID=A0ABD3H723_9MARC